MIGRPVEVDRSVGVVDGVSKLWIGGRRIVGSVSKTYLRRHHEADQSKLRKCLGEGKSQYYEKGTGMLLHWRYDSEVMDMVEPQADESWNAIEKTKKWLESKRRQMNDDFGGFRS